MSSRSSSFDNLSKREESENEEFSTKEEEYDFNSISNLVDSVSEILKEIISHEENKKNKNKGNNDDDFKNLNKNAFLENYSFTNLFLILELLNLKEFKILNFLNREIICFHFFETTEYFC